MMSALLLFARGAVILAVALVAVRLLRRAPAALRYLVLAAALAATLVLPVIEHVLPTWHTGALADELAVRPVVTAELPIPELAEPGPVLAPAGGGPAGVEVPWRSIAVALWLVGLAVALGRVAYGAARARRIVRRGLTARPAVAVAEVWRAVGGSGEPPRVVASDEADGPFVVGAIAPVVVVPRASTSWPAERWRIVLLHELAHVRQRDGVVNLVAQLACCLHWIDPLAWIAARRLREERELAADDAVLHAGALASSYAEHLVCLATAMPRRTPASVLAMATPSRFEARVIALLDAERSRRVGARRAIAAVIGAVAITAGVACVSPEGAPQPIELAAPVSSRSPGAPSRVDDRALPMFVEHELELAIDRHQATGAVAVVLDAATGKPLAVVSRGELDPRTARVPGSTIKPFAFAAALEAGTVEAGTELDCEQGARAYGTKVLRDASPNGVLDLGGILAVSSNVCTAKLVEPLGDLLGQSLRRYRLAAPGRVDTRTLDGAAVAYGEGVAVSPLELASAYTALAGGGVHHAPDGDGFRVMREDTARTVLGLLERVVTDPRGTGHAARVDGIRVAGKTGTTRSRPGSDRYYASFVGVAPIEAPRVVILVGIDGVTGSGGKVAAPVFAAIAARAAR